MARRGLNKRYVLMLRWVTPVVVVSLALTYAIVAYTRPVDPNAIGPDGRIEGLTSVLSRTISPDLVTFRFEEVAAAAGLHFVHFPDARQSLLAEDMGSGAAWGDYDNDGDPDLFLVNFARSVLPDHAAPEPGRCALFRNEGNGTFTDVSRQAGLDLPLMGMGAAWADYDNDNDLDLYITCYGPNVLMANNGDGTFTDVTDHAGVGDGSFGAGCAWADYDNDGDLDLYVCNYVRFIYRSADRLRTQRQYGAETPYTLNPSAYPPAPNRLYRNNGDGTFTEVATDAGVADERGRSLGAIWFDFDLDGWLDLYVANDVSCNGVYHNRGDGTFEDIGATSLAADYRGAMGLAAADIDHDGDQDLFVTHWIAQENALFRNMVYDALLQQRSAGRIFFMDIAEEQGLGQISLNVVGWATGFADFDNDGYPDLWIANGHTLEEPANPARLIAQRMLLLKHKPGEGFFDITTHACPTLAVPVVARGGAHADYDGDGRLDIVVMVHGGEPLLLHNTAENTSHWLSLDLRQVGANTYAVGARVRVRTGDLVQTAEVRAGSSYLSQHQHALHFGLGEAAQADEVEIHWPDGTIERLGPVPADQVLQLEHKAHYRRPPT